ncbi:hypothetical protein [Streptomyces bobili]
MAIPTTETTPIPDDEWQLDISITDSPRPVVSNCDTSDGRKSSCASSCIS